MVFKSLHFSKTPILKMYSYRYLKSFMVIVFLFKASCASCYAAYFTPDTKIERKINPSEFEKMSTPLRREIIRKKEKEL